MFQFGNLLVAAVQLSIILVKLYPHFGAAEKLIKKESKVKKKAQNLEQEERN